MIAGLVFDTENSGSIAMMGDGLALLDPPLFHEEIQVGGLVRPFDLWLDEGYGYYLTTHPEDLSNEAVGLFPAADRMVRRWPPGRHGSRRGRAQKWRVAK